MKSFFLLMAFFVFEAKAQVVAPVVEKVEETKVKIEKQVSGTSFFREHSHGTALVGYELLSTWIPSKFTFSYTHIFNKTWSVEAEFARGHFGAGLFGFDIASVTEYRYSILARRYTGNSFHWIFGLYKDDFRAKLGSDVLDDMSDTSLDDMNVKVVGATVGFGNRWQWSNGFTLGLDWVRMNMPLFDRKIDDGVLKNIDDGSDHDSVKKGLNRVASVPTFTLLGIYLGYTF